MRGGTKCAAVLVGLSAALIATPALAGILTPPSNDARTGAEALGGLPARA